MSRAMAANYDFMTLGDLHAECVHVAPDFKITTRDDESCPGIEASGTVGSNVYEASVWVEPWQDKNKRLRGMLICWLDSVLVYPYLPEARLNRTRR